MVIDAICFWQMENGLWQIYQMCHNLAKTFYFDAVNLLKGHTL